MYVYVGAGQSASVELRGQLSGELVLSFTLWVPEIRFTLSDLMAGAITHGGLSPAYVKPFL